MAARVPPPRCSCSTRTWTPTRCGARFEAGERGADTHRPAHGRRRERRGHLGHGDKVATTGRSRGARLRDPGHREDRARLRPPRPSGPRCPRSRHPGERAEVVPVSVEVNALGSSRTAMPSRRSWRCARLLARLVARRHGSLTDAGRARETGAGDGRGSAAPGERPGRWRGRGRPRTPRSASSGHRRSVGLVARRSWRPPSTSGPRIYAAPPYGLWASGSAATPAGSLRLDVERRSRISRPGLPR